MRRAVFPLRPVDAVVDRRELGQQTEDTADRTQIAAPDVRWQPLRRIVPDGIGPVRNALIGLCDEDRADLTPTTGAS